MLPMYIAIVIKIDVTIVFLIYVTSDRMLSISMQISVVKVMLTMLTKD